MAEEPSIFKSTKVMLDISVDDPSFDGQLLTHLNAVLSDLLDLGVGPVDGFTVTGDDENWEDLLGTHPEMNRVKTWVYLKLRMLWDPPQTSFLINAHEKQIDEVTWRIVNKEDRVRHAASIDEDVIVIDGGSP